MRESINNKINVLLKIINQPNIKKFNYKEDIFNFNDTKRIKIWIIRTYIFYELLLFVSLTLSDKNLYNSVYTDSKNHSDGIENGNNDFSFRPDIVNELHNFKMGIFGSITPTSDIDIGIQYSGTTLKRPGLAYIVSRFENVFIIFTGINSLKWDIETYADMMTLPNTLQNTDKKMKLNYPDYFYLDTTNFKKIHFQNVLVCAATSILRNYIMAEIDIDNRNITKQKITKLINNFNINQIISINNEFQSFYQEIKDDIPDDWLKEAKKIIIDYMTSDYNTSRYQYYSKVNIAEKSKFRHTKNLKSLNVNKISEIIKKIGISLSYRRESYNCYQQFFI